MFVPSSSIIDETDHDDLFRYDLNMSSTYLPGSPDEHDFGYESTDFQGHVAWDTFHVAGLPVSYQPFLDVEHARSPPWGHTWRNFEGVLGLRFNQTRPSQTTPNKQPPIASPWWGIVQLGLLDRNLFSIEIPRSFSDGIGELSLGAINPKYGHSEFKRLPVVDKDDDVWAVSADSLTLESSDDPIHEDFPPGATAVFTADWYSTSPLDLVLRIREALGVRCPFRFCEIPCDGRENLPDLVFGLAGQELRITAFEYAPMVLQDGANRCFFNMYSTERLYGGTPYQGGTVFLGIPFMNAFYR